VIAEARSNEGDIFLIFAGWSKDVVEGVKTHSLNESDAEVQEYTSDRERFGRGSYKEWYSKGRTPFALIHKETRKVAALAWFGPKPLGKKPPRFLSQTQTGREKETLGSGNWHTIAYRSYSPFRGKGLMTDFVRFAMTTYRAEFPDAKIWAIINTKNPGSLKLAHHLGFTPLPEVPHPGEDLTVMVLKNNIERN
jgi:RimJ/RimL family protein N-acetyltransferase